MAAAKVRSPKARKSAPPAFQPVQLATLVDAVPAGRDWLHEIKYDRYRILLAVGGGEARAYTRSGLDWSAKFPTIIAAAAKAEADEALIDGEAVVLDEKGRSSFQLMQGAWKGGHAKVVFYAFDLLKLDGEDTRALPLLDRKRLLAKLIGKRQSGVIRYSDHIVGEGQKLLAKACAAGLEGIIAKRANAHYAGIRTESWLKIKCLQRQEFLIVGWTSSDKDRGFRSLILATRAGGKLRYAGKVGTGFGMEEITRLGKLMRPLARKAATVEAPRAAVRGANWVEPKLVAEIAYAEMTADGVLRHPSYLGLREDKPARAVKLEVAKHLKPKKS
jgi:bifunctional non-homologous end joining protein LigD